MPTASRSWSTTVTRTRAAATRVRRASRRCGLGSGALAGEVPGPAPDDHADEREHDQGPQPVAEDVAPTQGGLPTEAGKPQAAQAELAHHLLRLLLDGGVCGAERFVHAREDEIGESLRIVGVDRGA